MPFLQLGHASIQTTMDRYGHIIPNTNHGAGERLDRMVFGEAVYCTAENV